MANEGSTKPTYEELEEKIAELEEFLAAEAEQRKSALVIFNEVVQDRARVRGLLQRRDQDWRDLIQDAIGQWGGPQYKFFNEAMARIWEAKKNFDKGLDLWGEPLDHSPEPPTFPQSSSLVPCGAESADIGKLDTPSGSAAYHQEHIEMQRRIKNQRQQLAKAYKDLEEKNRRIEYLEPFRQQVQGIAGSAETGGEKAAPDYENDPAHKQCVGFADWRALLYEISKLYGTIDSEWVDADIDNMNEFDPWDALRKLQATFPRSSQNQTVSSGVEGARDGTTGAPDESGSREPEKLNNAQNAVSYESLLGAMREYVIDQQKCGNPATRKDLREFRAWKNMPQDDKFDRALLEEINVSAQAESSLSICPHFTDGRKKSDCGICEDSTESSLSSPPPESDLENVISLIRQVTGERGEWLVTPADFGNQIVQTLYNRVASPELLPTQRKTDF